MKGMIQSPNTRCMNKKTDQQTPNTNTGTSQMYVQTNMSTYAGTMEDWKYDRKFTRLLQVILPKGNVKF